MIKPAGDPPGWTGPRVARLVVLWERGLDAGRIATALGAEFSRSAVVGKLVRLGLRRDKAERQAAQAGGGRRAQRGKRHGPPMIPVAPAPPSPCDVAPLLVELTALARRGCRWPYGEGPAMRFCGHKAKPGGPYCSAHHAIAYLAVLPPLTLEALQVRPAGDPLLTQARRDR